MNEQLPISIDNQFMPSDRNSMALDLSLNDGTWSSQRSVEVLASFNHNNALRHYTSPENQSLVRTIAAADGVSADHVFVANGSGPLLKQCLPYLIKRSILASPMRIMRHLVARNGFPLITPAMTYGKIAQGATKQNIRIRPLPLSPDNNFQLSAEDLRTELKRQDGIVYIANPNNPTGNVLIQRHDLVAALTAHPHSIFWLDEAYVQYVDPALHTPLADLVPHHRNLIVSRSFSFAYGLAGLRLGYLLCDPELVRQFSGHVTTYRVGRLQEAMGIASLTDPEHLPFVRKETATQRNLITESLSKLPGVQSFPSQTNFVLFRFTDGRSGHELAARVAKQGLLIHPFEPAMGFSHAHYFRITVGLEDENQQMLKLVNAAIKSYPT